MTTQALRQEQGVVEIFSNAIRLYQDNYSLLLPLAFAVVPFGVASGYIAERLWPFVGGLLLFVPISLVQALSTGGMIHIVDRARLGNPTTLVEATRFVGQRAPKLLKTELLALVMKTITIILFPYFLVRWWFTNQAVAIDDAQGWDALEASSSVVLGRWWRAAFVLLLVIVLRAVISFATVLIVRSGAPPDALLWRFVVASVSSLWVPLGACAETVLYFDLKARAATAALWTSTS